MLWAFSAGALAAVSDSNNIVKSATTDEIQSIYKELGLPLEVVGMEPNMKTFGGSFDPKHRFFVSLTGCKNDDCKIIVVWTVVAGADVSFDFVNFFNAGTNVGRTAILPIDQKPNIVAHDFVVAGGVTRNAVALQPAVFVELMNSYGEQRMKYGSNSKSTSIAKAAHPALAAGPALRAGVSPTFADTILPLAKQAIADGKFYELQAK